MTEIYSSPSAMKLSVKRPFIQEEVVASEVDHFAHSKRLRFNSMDIEEEAGGGFAETIESSRRIKRTRDDIKQSFSSAYSSEELLRQMGVLKTFYESAVLRKDAETAHLKGVNAQLHEENRVLKRAVAVQDHRLKDAISQGQQLQDILSQAAQKLLALERDNASLRIAMSSSTGPDYIHPNIPPDVF